MMNIKPSLRSRVIKHVVLPLVVLWALGTAVALGVANYFAGQAFDRSLLDDAYAVAANVNGFIAHRECQEIFRKILVYRMTICV